MTQRHGIEHTHRPDHRRFVTSVCECGQTVAAGYRSMAEHIEHRRAARHSEKARLVA